LSFLDKTTKAPATSNQKKQEGRTIRAMAAAVAPNIHKAGFCESHTTLVMSDAEIGRLLDVKLQEFYLDLISIFPGFDAYTEKARTTLSDMI